MNAEKMRNSIHLDVLQSFEQHILKRHQRFTDKALNHIAYIDKELWKSYSDTQKQQILSDTRKNNNKIIVIYDFIQLTVFSNKSLEICHKKIGVFCKYFL
jgi:hypothetical protein